MAKEMSREEAQKLKFSTGPVERLKFAFDHYIKEIMILPFFGQMIGATRKNDKKPAILSMVCPDDWVKNINGHADTQDFYYLIRVPRDIQQRMESRIITPQEASSGR